MAALLLALAVIVPSAVASEEPRSGRDFYVSPSGNDSGPGVSPGAPWRTLAKVNAAALLPGDRVHLLGGAVFKEPLAPYAGMAGTTVEPIVFDSYGSGRATVQASIYLKDVANLTFENLNVAPATGQGVFSSAAGSGAHGITLRNLTISHVPLAGINANNPADDSWLIESVHIEETGDSGIHFKGSNYVIANSTILKTGTDSSIGYPRHGIYAAGPHATIVENAIVGFSMSGISLRFQDSFVQGNRISGGVKGISFDNQATAPGATKILYNTISHVSDTGIIVAAPASESFLLANNTVVGAGRYGIYVQVVPALTIANNLVQATAERANLLNVRPPASSYSEHHNLWSGARTAFYWNGSARTFSAYQRLSGQGTNDLTMDPSLDATYIPMSGSPAIDRGTSDVEASLHYTPGCDGRPFYYCGTSPDLGSREVRTTDVP